MRGRDKLLEPVGDVPLLRRVLQRACDSGADVFVTLPPDAADRASICDGLPVTPVLVPTARDGMAESVRAGVNALPLCDAFMLMLADMPDIETDDLRALMAARMAHPGAKVWRAATAAGAPGHPILCDAALRPGFASLTGDSGGDTVIRAYAAETHLVRLSDDRARHDLDTPEDWAAWRAKNP